MVKIGITIKALCILAVLMNIQHYTAKYVLVAIVHNQVLTEQLHICHWQQLMCTTVDGSTSPVYISIVHSLMQPWSPDEYLVQCLLN